MTSRVHLYQLAQAQKLSADAARQLESLAGLSTEPAQAAQSWWPTVRLLAAGLLGFGLILWVAANWDALGRWGQFALLQGWVTLGAVLAWRIAALRVPMGLICLLGIGALFAYFGQTYQTGADPWQLFALWAALALPLCLGCRSDVLWLPWGVIASTAIGLWTTTQTGYSWRADPGDLGIHALAWGMLLALAFSLGPMTWRWTGAGLWSYRAMVFAVATSITVAAAPAVFDSYDVSHYWMGLLFLLAFGLVTTSLRWFDIFGTCAIVFCLDLILMAGLMRLILPSWSGNWLGSLFILGLALAALLAATASGIMRLHRRHRDSEA
jgi:uncharacterized membrane protein